MQYDSCGRVLLTCCLIVTLAANGIASEPAQPLMDAGAEDQHSGLAVCFAPGTPAHVVQDYAQRFPGRQRTSLQTSSDDYQFSDGERWSRTATDGAGLRQGDPTTLTWSIMPDGTSIAGFAGEGTSPSNLESFLNGIYGSRAQWFPLFEQVFDRWSEVTGITYVHEPNDDGAARTQFSDPPGQLGVRGDIRIGGHAVDGWGMILAYNMFPDIGDMVIDTADGSYNDTSNNSRFLRNVIAHEHGHGLGLQHVCPINETKLMEPWATTRFDGPQHDDILAAHRAYGDWLEHNDTTGTAADLGTFVAGSSNNIASVSIDDNGDLDLFSFEVSSVQSATVRVQPVGSTYRSGPQNWDGSCTSGTNFDTLRMHDLSLQILDQDGTTVVAEASSRPAGEWEEVVDSLLPSGAGTYYIRVEGGSTNAPQLYDLTIRTESAVVPPTVYEASERSNIVDLQNAVGTASVSPFEQTPAASSPLYYQVDDAMGNPDVIWLVKAGGVLRIFF